MIDLRYYEQQVQGPGRFEGEGPATPYFVDQMMIGDGEPLAYDGTWGTGAEMFIPTEEERDLFNLSNVVVLHWDSHGFYGLAQFDSTEDAENAFIAKEE